jgi:hypothetical protein
LDEILPTLDVFEQAIYLQLFRLSWGHQRETCIIGAPRLAERANIGLTKARAALKALAARGLVVPLSYNFAGRWDPNAGTEFRIVVPGIEFSRFSSPSRGDSPSRDDSLSRGGGPSRGGRMKDNKKQSHERAPVAVAPAPDSLSVYDVRKIAARFRELHHGESDYTKDRLRSDVRTALIGEGREPDDRLIDDAIGT